MVSPLFTREVRKEVGATPCRVLPENLDGPLTDMTTLKVRGLAVVLANVQSGSASLLFRDNQVSYRLSRYPKDLTDPCVRPLRMGFHEPDHVPGPAVIVPFLPSSSHRPPLSLLSSLH